MWDGQAQYNNGEIGSRQRQGTIANSFLKPKRSSDGNEGPLAVHCTPPTIRSKQVPDIVATTEHFESKRGQASGRRLRETVDYVNHFSKAALGAGVVGSPVRVERLPES
jgi:hypothetical protein